MVPRYFVPLPGASALAIASGTEIGAIPSSHRSPIRGEASWFERGCEVRHGGENLVQLEATQLARRRSRQVGEHQQAAGVAKLVVEGDERRRGDLVEATDPAHFDDDASAHDEGATPIECGETRPQIESSGGPNDDGVTDALDS